jgi:hypothetical protein
MRRMNTFYAWQSDTPQELNRRLIEIALRDAATRINEDSSCSVEIQIDSDTQGVPGTPPITDTILKKIDGCDLLVPDLTFVARTAAGKFVPNPNVMAEFGYALRAKTHAALMPVMNTAFGAPEELPFDLGHLRHPIQYRAETTVGDGERRRVRAELSQAIEEKLRLQLVATEPRPSGRFADERMRLVRENLSRLTEPWQKPLLRELIVRGRMDEPHASGFLVKRGFAHLDGTLNGLRFHTSLVVVDSFGQFSINPDLREALTIATEDEEERRTP